MQQTWLASTYAGQMVSDYLTVTFVQGRPFGTFALANPPNPTTGLFDEAIYATPLGGRDDLTAVFRQWLVTWLRTRKHLN
jgi:hypothetical protein